MPNIVVSMYNYINSQNEHAFPPFYETFIEGLKRYGNNVLCYHHSNMNYQFSEIIPDEILSQIQMFKPDLFVFFNNNFWDVYPYFDVPIVIYDVDSPNLYANKVVLTKNNRNYTFIVNQQSGIELIKSKYYISDNSIRYIAPFTEVHSEPSSISCNIVFCGSHWLWSGCDFIYEFMKTQPTKEDRLMAQNILKRFKENPFKQYYELYDELGYNTINKLKFDARMASGRLSGIKRANCLSAISDLGLEIRGNYWNHVSLNYFPELALCYNSDEVTSLLATQNVYNAAKIGFNINHIQAISGFSWRVCDILASNACLVSEYSPDLEALFKGTQIPMYHTISEARELCKYILANEDYRLNIVEQSHDIINKRHRFINALHEMEDFLHMRLRDDSEGSLKIVKIQNSTFSKVTNKLKLSQRVKRKIWFLLNENLKKQNVI